MKGNARPAWFPAWAACILFVFAISAEADVHIYVNEADTNAVQEAFLGVGFRVSAHLDEATPREINEVFAKRWHELSPSHALAAHTWSWDWKRVVPFMKTVLKGSEIWLTTVEPSGATPDKLPDPAKVAGMLERLVKKEGVANVTTYCLNAGRLGPDSRGPTADAARFCSELSGKLKALGLKIRAVPGLPPGTITSAEMGNTPLSEPEAGLRLAEATMAAILAKAPAVTCMPFADLPPSMSGGKASETGLFEWKKTDFKTRPPYYAAAILAKYIRGPVRAYPVTCRNPKVKALFLRAGDGWATALIINRNDQQFMSQLHLTNMNLPGDKRHYVYRAGSVPMHPYGDIQPCEDHRVHAGKRVGWHIPLPPNSLSVMHCVPDTEPPEQIRFVDVSDTDDGGKLLKWDPVVDEDVSYYRVIRMNMPRFRFARKTPVGSTVATQLIDTNPPKGKKAYYAVIGVDHYDNYIQ